MSVSVCASMCDCVLGVRGGISFPSHEYSSRGTEHRVPAATDQPHSQLSKPSDSGEGFTFVLVDFFGWGKRPQCEWLPDLVCERGEARWAGGAFKSLRSCSHFWAHIPALRSELPFRSLFLLCSVQMSQSREAFSPDKLHTLHSCIRKDLWDFCLVLCVSTLPYLLSFSLFSPWMWLTQEPLQGFLPGLPVWQQNKGLKGPQW